MVELDLKINFDEEKRLMNISGTLMAVHCHHFNTNLFQSLEDAGYVDGHDIVRGAAEKVAFKQFSTLLKTQNPPAVSDKLAMAAELFRTFGFGTLEFDALSDDCIGIVTSPISHLCKGWLSKFGKRKEPLCFFTVGFIQGICEAITGTDLGTFNVVETQCISVGAHTCSFEVKK